jgi:thiamine biosynthesis lipoprotein
MEMIEHEVFHSMGIPVHLTLIGVTKEQSQQLRDEAKYIFDKWDLVFSRFRIDSQLFSLNNNSGKWNNVSIEMFAVIEKCINLAKETNGLFDPSIGSYLAAAGYGLPENYILPSMVPTYKNIELDKLGLKIKTAKSQILEPAGIVKGMAIDDAGKSLGLASAWMINAGGDILTHGKYPDQGFWNIAIQSPDNIKSIVSVVKIKDEAIATSGDYETKWISEGKEWHHQINTKTGAPTEGIKSVTVIAPNAEISDTAASIISLTGIENGILYAKKNKIPYFIIDSNGKQFKNELFEERQVS